MRIAILGAGFSGLGAAWHLLKGAEVVVFDAKGVGGGASGIAAGLVHPYVGEEGRRSLFADEGMQATRALIDAAEEALGERVANRDGILRYAMNEAQNAQFLSHCQRHGDVEPYGEGCFLIKAGMTIDCPRYLQGLWKALAAKGAELVIKEVSDLRELSGFDHVVVAAGAGIIKFPELAGLKFSILKGQVLVCKGERLPAKSAIGKGYIALSEGGCHIGSTYERDFADESPNLPLTQATLFPKIALFFPEVDQLQTTECLAALRVIRKGHYTASGEILDFWRSQSGSDLNDREEGAIEAIAPTGDRSKMGRYDGRQKSRYFPLAAKVREGLWALTAMGSRGLLYHGLMGRILAEEVL